jgi:hypothetical protein
VNKIKKFSLAASLMLAITFVFSCSDSGNGSDDESGDGSTAESIKLTEIYNIKEKDDNSFTYVRTFDDYNCLEGGVFEEEIAKSEEEPINYLINNNIMSWEHKSGDDTLNFNGNSNELSGTWTRTKNKDASCELKTEEYEGEINTYYDCKSDWRFSKLDFTETTLTITTDYCLTDFEIDGEETEDGKIRIIDCNSAELSKGSEKLIIKATKGGANQIDLSYSYKGKTCTLEEGYSKEEYKEACKKAWDEYGETEEYWQDYIYDFLNEDFEKCTKDMFPEDDNEEAALKSLAKSKLLFSNK